MISLVEAMQRGEIAAEPAVVLSNRPDAPGLALADGLGVPTAVVDSKQIRPRAAHEQKVIEVLREQRVDLVCLAGYMRLLSPLLVREFPGTLGDGTVSVFRSRPPTRSAAPATD